MAVGRFPKGGVEVGTVAFQILDVGLCFYAKLMGKDFLERKVLVLCHLPSFFFFVF